MLRTDSAASIFAENLAVLHCGRWVGQEGDVGEQVAGDSDNVGIEAGLELSMESDQRNNFAPLMRPERRVSAELMPYFTISSTPEPACHEGMDRRHTRTNENFPC